MSYLKELLAQSSHMLWMSVQELQHCLINKVNVIIFTLALRHNKRDPPPSNMFWELGLTYSTDTEEN